MLWYHWEAMLISYLAIRKTVVPFTSMDELVDKTSFKVAVWPGTLSEDTFKFATEKAWQTAWTDRIEPYLDNYADNGGKMIKYPANDPNIALYDNFPSISSFPEYTRCEVIAIPGKYNFLPFAYGFQKDSPYLGMFNFYLKEMIEKGSLKQISEKYETPAQVCPDLSGLPLGFESCFTAFLVLLFGMLIGLILMSIEVLSKALKLYVPLLSMYDQKDDEELSNFHNEKDLMILSLQEEIRTLSLKLKKLNSVNSK